jgi:hypothetical protein
VLWDLVWDDEVDVVCGGAGIAGLASAIAAVDADADVFVAEGSGEAGKWFPSENADADTAAYLHQLTDDLALDNLPRLDAELPVRLAKKPPPGRYVPPFFGSRLRDWAGRCIASPTGYLYTRVGDWNSGTITAPDGQLYEVTEVGAVSADPRDPAGSVNRWLLGEAEVRDVRVRASTELDHLVFEDGVVTGAVFTTDDGTLAIRARHGVLICQGAQRPPGPPSGSDALLTVALVSTAGSRFGRVELLTSDPDVAATAV